MNKWLETIIVLSPLFLWLILIPIITVYGGATPTTYNFTHCYKQTGSNYIVYYCIGDAPHQRTVFYMELANP